MNLNDAVTCLWLTKSHWPNFTVLTGDKVALQAGAWLDVLSDLQLSDVREALARLDAGGIEFPPTPGQIRHCVLASRGVCAPEWDQAYTAVIDSIHRYGANAGGLPEWGGKPTRPKLHTAIEEAVKAMGGWYDVGMAQVTDAWRAQFRNAYEAAAKRADREALMPPLVRELAERAAKTLALPSADRA